MKSAAVIESHRFSMVFPSSRKRWKTTLRRGGWYSADAASTQGFMNGAAWAVIMSGAMPTSLLRKSSAGPGPAGGSFGKCETARRKGPLGRVYTNPAERVRDETTANAAQLGELYILQIERHFGEFPVGNDFDNKLHGIVQRLREAQRFLHRSAVQRPAGHAIRNLPATGV